MLFYTDKKGKCLLHPEVYKLVPAFRKLNEQQVLYMVLVTDSKSIFHQLTIKERRLRAKRWVFGKGAKNPEDDPLVRQAILEYTKLDYNEKRHTILVYREKRDAFQEKMLYLEDPDKVIMYGKAISQLQSMIDQLEIEVTQNAQTQASLKGDKKISLIETMRANKSLFELRDKAREEQEKLTIQNDLEKNSDDKNMAQ